MAGQLPLLAAHTAKGAAPEMGVYVGIQQMEYAGLAAPHLSSFGPYNASGSPFSVAAGRLSFTYGLKGECLHRRRGTSPIVLAPHSSTLGSLASIHSRVNALIAT